MDTVRAGPRAWISGTAALAATLIVLTGCGGSSSGTSSASSSTAPASASPSSTSQSQTTTSQTTPTAAQFSATIAPVLNQFKNASQRTGAALQQAGSQTDAEVAAAFRAVETRWKSALAKLETLRPPPQFISAYNRLKTQIRRVDTDLAAIVSAAQTHNAAAAKTSATKLVNDIVSAKATSTTISNRTP
jgi:hypothetical protein